MKIAIILTCHNRRKVTLQCLGHLYSIMSNIDVYCLDDASSDGTADAIKKEFPQVNLVSGDGNLFWCRGMNMAWKEAVKKGGYDFYFWLNDDLVLYENAFSELLECSKIVEDKAVITGLVQEETTKEAIYGGTSFEGKLITANGEMQNVKNMNGNFVLVPDAVVKKIGTFDEVYHHDLGDVDYGMTAREAGFNVVSSRCYIGCTDAALKSKNERIRLYGVNIVKRFKKLYSPLGSNPFITFHFKKKHENILSAVAFFIYVHVINVLPDFVWDIIRR